MRVWINIDNPPQVQYLLPFVDAFRSRGLEVLVTARDYGMTTELLRARGAVHHTIGRELTSSRIAKMRGTVDRALRLVLHVRRGSRPLLLLGASRSATMAAWIMRVPSFTIVDYEHVELGSFRALGTTVLHPAAIDAAIFSDKGFSSDRLMAFAGIKEDITFAGLDVDSVTAHEFQVPHDGRALVLIRPPSETSHYSNQASHDLTRSVLARLAPDPAVQVIFTPRHRAQVAELGSHRWSNEPIVLEKPVEFLSLLKAVDWVICAGGTMLREAAYLGIPAVSIFRSEAGSVDRLLEQCGAVRFVTTPEDLDAIDWHGARSGHDPKFRHHPGTLADLTERMLERSGRSRSLRRG